MEFTFKQKAIHQLLLRSSIEKDVGLYNGKMGLILFFAHYSKITGNIIFDDTADELMDELKEEIYKELPIGFASGLSGIGWGIEYLIQNGFVEGDSLEVCEEIDKQIMEKDPRRIQDYSVETGLGGVLHYVLAHIKGVIAQHSRLPFDETYLKDLYYTVSNIPSETELSEEFKALCATYSNFCERKAGFDYSLQLLSIIEDSELEKEKLNNYPLGLKSGLSGYLLKNKLRTDYERSVYSQLWQ